MNRRNFITWASGAPAVLGQRAKRNLVFILSDDHRYDMLGCRGHPWLKTPNLDRLAGGGILFENAFVTTSLCSPSRASILTGLYAHAHGVAENDSTGLAPHLPTFPQLLQRHGYRTGFVGKWHLGGGGVEPEPGFDRWVSFRGQGNYINPTLSVDGNLHSTRGYVTDLLTDEALSFIRESASEPFLLFLSHKAVHAGFVPPTRFQTWYREESVPRPASMANTEETYRGKPEWVRRQRNSYHGVDGIYNCSVRFDDVYRDYCRTAMALDESVGRLMQELDEQGLLNDTLIFYMGDNGFLFGEHGLIDKRSMYEPSIRVPMIAHCPDLFGGGRRIPGMALNIDVCATFLEAGRAAVPDTVQGRSLLPLIRGTEQWRTEFLYEYFWDRDFPQTPAVIGLRSDQYSYMQYHGIWDMDELYDIQADPEQTNNLLGKVRITTEPGRLSYRITDPGLVKLVAELESRMWRIQEQTPRQV